MYISLLIKLLARLHLTVSSPNIQSKEKGYFFRISGKNEELITVCVSLSVPKVRFFLNIIALKTINLLLKT